MTSDVALTGNVNDLPDDFFAAPEPAQSPLSGNVNDLPDDFFSPAETINETVYRQDNDSVISAPADLNANETTYLDDVQNQGQSEGQFFGLSKLWDRTVDIVSIPYKAVIGTAVNIGVTLEVGNRRQISDAIRQGLTEDVDALYAKQSRGESLTREEQAVLLRDISEQNNLFSFLFKSPADIAREKTVSAVEEGDTETIDRLVNKSNELETSSAELRAWADNTIQKHFARPTDEESTLAERVFYDISGVGTTIAASIGLGVVTKNPVASAALFREIQKNDIYLEARDSGLGPQESQDTATLAGNVEGALEFVGVHYFFKLAEKSRPLWRNLYRMAEEAIQEGSQTFGEELITQSEGIREVDVQGAIGNILYSMFLGSVGAGGGIAVAEIGQRRAQEQGLNLPPEALERLAQIVEENRPILEKALADDIRAQGGGIRSNEADEARAVKVIQDFAEGRDIDTSNFTDEERRALGDIEAPAQAVPSRLDQIRAQEGKGFLTVPRKPEGIISFLRKAGGIRDDGGKLSARDAQRNSRARGLVKKDGLELDRARELAVEAGFLTDSDPNAPPISTIEDLLDAIDIELAGGDVVRDGDLDTLLTRDEIIRYNEELDQQRQAEFDPRQEVKSFSSAFKEGVRLGRRDVKAAQTALIEALEKTDLTLNDRAKFIRSIKNIQTAEQLEKRLPKIEQRVVDLLEKNRTKTLKKNIKKELSTTKVRKQSGKPAGRFTADIQVRLDALRDISRMMQEEAKLTLEKNLEEIPTVEQAEQNGLLAVIAGEADIDTMAFVLENIKSLKEEGKGINDFKTEARKARQSELRQRARDAVPEADPLDKPGLRSALRKKAGEVVAGFNSMFDGWYDTMDIVFGNDADLVNELGFAVSDAFQRVKGRGRVASEDAIGRIMDAFGFTTERQLIRQLHEDSKVRDLGVYTNTREERVRLKLSKSEARKRWMELQDESLRETLTDPDGNAYSEDMIAALSEFLTQEDIAVAQAQLDFYRDFYNEINDVYREIYNVNLPFNEFYSPISRKYNKSSVTDDFLKEMGFRRSVAPGSLKSRVANIQEIRNQSDIVVLQKHILEMAHWMEFAPVIQDINAVFGRGDIRSAIEENYGGVMLQNIDSFITDFTAGGITNAEAFNFIDRLRVNFTTSVLGAKPAMAVKQMTSFIAYADNVPTSAFIAGVADFVKNPVEAARILGQSELLKARGSNLERDIKDAARSQEFSAFRKTPNFKNMLLLPVRLGDKGAILLGGWSVYKYHIDQGATHEEALTQFDRATSLAQQSSDLDQLSRWQRGGSFAKLFTMFLSAPNQYLRREVSAIRNLARGNITKAEFAKKFVIYHFLLPTFFQFVANAGRWDDEDQIRAAILGSFNGMFIIGEALSAGVSLLQGDDVFQDNNSITEFIYDILKGMKNLSTDVDSEDFFEALKDIGEGVGKLTGFNVEQGFNIAEGIEDIADGDVREGALKVLGWPPAVADESGGKKSKRKGIGFM